MQAALNVLREQRRAMRDTHRQIAADAGLRAADYGHWQQLYIQSNVEIHELSEAIALLQQAVGDCPAAQDSRAQVRQQTGARL